LRVALLDDVRFGWLFLQGLQKSLRGQRRLAHGRASDHWTTVASPPWHSPCSWPSRGAGN